MSFLENSYPLLPICSTVCLPSTSTVISGFSMLIDVYCSPHNTVDASFHILSRSIFFQFSLLSILKMQRKKYIVQDDNSFFQYRKKQWLPKCFIFKMWDNYSVINFGRLGYKRLLPKASADFWVPCTTVSDFSAQSIEQRKSVALCKTFRGNNFEMMKLTCIPTSMYVFVSMCMQVKGKACNHFAIYASNCKQYYYISAMS